MLSIAEYAQLGVTTEKIYFSRAYYDSTRKILEPAIEEWTTDCHCGMPTNPDLVYQECGVCERWFHVNCVEEYVDKNGGLCRECTNKRIVKIEID